MTKQRVDALHDRPDDNVGLDVDAVAWVAVSQTSALQRSRDQGDAETRPLHFCNRQADAIERDSTLGDQEWSGLGLNPETKLAFLIDDLFYATKRVHVALHEMAVERIAEPQRGLQVDAGAGFEAPERGAAERLVDYIENRDGAALVREGEADAIDREAGAEREGRGERPQVNMNAIAAEGSGALDDRPYALNDAGEHRPRIMTRQAAGIQPAARATDWMLPDRDEKNHACSWRGRRRDYSVISEKAISPRLVNGATPTPSGLTEKSESPMKRARCQEA